MEALSATAESTTQSATMGTVNIAQQLAGLSSGTSSVHHTTNTPSVETAATSSNSSEEMPHLQQGLSKNLLNCIYSYHIPLKFRILGEVVHADLGEKVLQNPMYFLLNPYRIQQKF